ncbi:hypothetical protein SK854_22315 [Lentzea sp. BCCO 10_0061]|jgi:hypothetical protein|uniref:ArsR family transcriptional regulator n=1 Tax=Lentzea sokolovensis TaxID=3095429 RepID=A0ABU4UZC8_9PSEU|nr:hypothetical protein [Lentzea sp. BCCO 10_0061]MDX8144861.1 hypothetical protein [Lentzea sp. BCCO 10_0061]
MTDTSLTHRDRAVLRAVADGRCEIAGSSLLVDGLCCADQFAGLRLTTAGLISARSGPAALTSAGYQMLAA